MRRNIEVMPHFLYGHVLYNLKENTDLCFRNYKNFKR